MGKANAVADALFAKLQKDPDDDAAYLVYADAIGGPHGELIVAMSQGQGAATAALLEKHKKLVFGSTKLANHPGIAWDWHLGFLRGIRYVPDTGDKPEQIIEDIVALPIGKLVREIVVFSNYDFQTKPLAKVKLPPTCKPMELAEVFVDPAACKKAGAKGRWLQYEATDATLPKALFDCVHLEYLELSGDTLRDIPADLAELQKLRRLDTDWMSGIRTIAPEVFGIESLGYMSMYDCDGLKDRYHMGRVNALLGGFVRAKTPSRRRVFETTLFLGDLARAKKLAQPGDALAALDSNVALVREQALALLADTLPDPFAGGVIEGATFLLLGKTNYEKAQLATKLGDAGFALVTKPSDEVAYVIAGDAPGGKQLTLGKPIVLERHLPALWTGKVKLLAAAAGSGDSTATKPAKGAKGAKPAKGAKGAKPAKLAKAAPAIDVTAALRTRDTAQIRAALATLQDGVEPSLYADLVVVAQDVTLDTKVRDGAKKLLALHAPPSLTAALKQHLKSSLLLEGMGETKRTDRITEFARAAKVVDGMELAQLLVARARAALGYVFDRGKPADIDRALAAIAKDGHLDLHTAELTTVTDRVAAMKTVTSLDLSNNHFAEIPPAVLAMKHLVKLDLSGNHIWKIPDGLGALTKLEVLDLGYNRLRTFPPSIFKLTNLVELDVSNGQNYVDNEVRITGLPDAIGKLTKLTKLSYRFNLLEQGFPASLFSLKHLVELDLFQCALPAEIPAALAKLPKLKILDVRYSNWWERRKELKKLLPKVDFLERD